MLGKVMPSQKVILYSYACYLNSFPLVRSLVTFRKLTDCFAQEKRLALQYRLHSPHRFLCFVLFLSATRRRVCEKAEGHHCMNTSCCPFLEILKKNATHGFCTWHGEHSVCCNKPANCDWQEDVRKGKTTLLDQLKRVDNAVLDSIYALF